MVTLHLIRDQCMSCADPRRLHHTVQMQDKDVFEISMPVESGEITSVDLLKSATGLASKRIKHAMSCGAVWLERGRKLSRLRRVSRALRHGDILHCYYNAKVLAKTVPAAIQVADHKGYSVWNKPYGMWSQGSKWGDHCAIGRYVEKALSRPTFVVHRLDRAATGLILVAHSKSAAAALSALFRERQIQKHYAAITAADVSSWSLPLTLSDPIDEKPAVTHCHAASATGRGHDLLIDLSIETGRKHQIRRHLASNGAPIIGDRLYGDAGPDDPNLKLMAYRLAFKCPLSDADRHYELDTDALLRDA